MSRVNKHGKYISELINKSENAQNKGFYLESIFLSHSILEDRLRRTMKKVRNDYGASRKIPDAVKDFQFRIKKKEFFFDEFFSNNLMDKIIGWKKSKRDKLTHELEKNVDIINDTNLIKDIANEGYELSRELCNAVMNWKNKVKNEGLLK